MKSESHRIPPCQVGELRLVRPKAAFAFSGDMTGMVGTEFTGIVSAGVPDEAVSGVGFSEAEDGVAGGRKEPSGNSALVG